MEKPLVFVSHSSKDAKNAFQLVADLERRDIECWIAPRNISPGTAYDEAIVAALDKCTIMIVLLSEHSLASRHVRSEVSRAVSDGKQVLPVRLVDIEIQGGLKFFLELSQYVDLFSFSDANIIDSIATTIKNPDLPQKAAPHKAAKKDFLSGRTLILGATAVPVIALAISMIVYQWGSKEDFTQSIQNGTGVALESIKVPLIDIYPEFMISGDKIALRSWSINPDQRVDVSKVSAAWRINGASDVAFDFMNPKEMTLTDLKDFKSLELVVFSTDPSNPATKDYTFDVRKLMNDMIANVSRNFTAETRFFSCGPGGCDFMFWPLGVCEPVVKALSLSGDALLAGTPDSSVDLPLSFCDEIDMGAMKAITGLVCIPEHFFGANYQQRNLKLNIELIDGTKASRSAVMGYVNGPANVGCLVTL